ncbi:MAG: heme-binding protein [Bryobacterales bacterium]|nr:heme-binding protein [Bryobacterales bacterium]
MFQRYDLNLAEARAAIDAMRTELERRGLKGVLAVGDSRGDLIAFERMDGAPLPSITVATNKVYAAARERITTREIGRNVRSPEHGFDVAYWGDPKMLGWAGGVPVFHEGVVVGAVAVSGLDEDTDEEMARLGIAAMATLS